MSDVDFTSFNRPDNTCMGNAQIDNVARAVLSLTREVCVLTDRMMVMEAVLEANGIADVHDAVERHQPDEELQARISEAMAAVTRSVMDSLQGAEPELT